MNINALKTLVLGSGFLTLVGPYILNFALKIFGCTGDDPLTAAVEVATCSGGDLFTIPAGFQTLIGGIVITAALALTGWFKSGTVTQNFLSPSVPVVPIEAAKVGVVTEAQVAEPGAGKKEFSAGQAKK